MPPMAGVTDIVFRSVVRKIDPNCLMSTEMVSSRALMHQPKTRLMDLDAGEHPIGIQIFGHEPDVMAQAAAMAEAKGADFVDINMGCPVPKITKGKDGCALMKEPELARDIIREVRQAIKIPLTVKFRLGWDDGSRNAVEFGRMVEESGGNGVTVHGRTRSQFYSGQADWHAIGEVKKALSIPVFGNGDVFEPHDALKLLEITGADGVAVARGSLGNPWLIPRITKFIDTGILDDPPDDIEKLIAAYWHCIGLINYKGERVGTNESRKHMINYTKGIHKSAQYRNRLTGITSDKEAHAVLAELALQTGGKQGLDYFLLSTVHKDDFEDSKHVGEGDSNHGKHFHAPVNVGAVLPVAK